MDNAHPDFALHGTVRTLLEDQGLNVVDIAAPQTVKDNRDWVDYSYINHYVCNDAVIVPTFGDRQDSVAKEQLAELYPKRVICGVDGRVLFAMGGGVHCITQQQPAQ
jgi:agmatine deiminase